MRPKRFLEIGTYDGFTTLNLAANIDGDGLVYTLDLPQNQDQISWRDKGISNACVSPIVGSKYRQEPEAAKIVQIWADSSQADWAKFGAPFDMILIDGSHDSPYVWSDSLNAVKSIRPGGTILWHDYGQFLAVSRAMDKLAKDLPIHAILGSRLACLRRPDPEPRSATVGG
jgi:predicted O-methyltransferase YrrM